MNLINRLDRLEEQARHRQVQQIPSWVVIEPPDPTKIDNTGYFGSWEDVLAVYPDYPHKVYQGFDPEAV